MNNFGKFLYVIWFFFYFIVVVNETIILKNKSIGEQKIAMVLGTSLLLLLGLILFLSTIFIVSKKTKWIFGFLFLITLIITFIFYLTLKENSSLVA